MLSDKWNLREQCIHYCELDCKLLAGFIRGKSLVQCLINLVMNPGNANPNNNILPS